MVLELWGFFLDLNSIRSHLRDSVHNWSSRKTELYFESKNLLNILESMIIDNYSGRTLSHVLGRAREVLASELIDKIKIAITKLKTTTCKKKKTRPRTAKFPCSICDKNCNSNQDGIFCTHCFFRYIENVMQCPKKNMQSYHLSRYQEKPPRQNPPDKNPLDKNPPCQNPSRQKPPRQNL